MILNTAKMSFSNMLMFLVPIVVTPILSRLYGPEPFGDWGIFSSFIAIASLALFLGFENTIVKAQDNELKNLVILCLTTSFLFCLITALAFCTGLHFNITFFSTFPEPVLLIAYLAIYAIYYIAYNLCNRSGQFSSLAIAHTVLGSSQAIFRLAFGFTAINAFNGLILGTTMAQGIAMIYLLFCLQTFCRQWKTQHACISSIKSLVIKYKNFPFYDAPSSILSFAAFNLPVIILAVYFSKESIGCFSLVLQLLLLPISFIGSAMGRVYYQELCQHDDNPDFIAQTTNKVTRITAFISILPLLFFACGGDSLIFLFLGTQWSTAGEVALCLSLWSFPTILTQPLLPLFRTLDRQRTLLYYDAAYFVFGIGTIIMLCQLSHNLILILALYATVCFIVKLLLFRQILALSNLRWSHYWKYIPLWTISISILAFRLFQLL